MQAEGGLIRRGHARVCVHTRARPTEKGGNVGERNLHGLII